MGRGPPPALNIIGPNGINSSAGFTYYFCSHSVWIKWAGEEGLCLGLAP
jgi:hypothetical protein